MVDIAVKSKTFVVPDPAFLAVPPYLLLSEAAHYGELAIDYACYALVLPVRLSTKLWVVKCFPSWEDLSFRSTAIYTPLYSHSLSCS